MGKLVLYMIPLSPPSRAVLMTAKALNIELELKFIDLKKREQLSPGFLKINPQHTIPVLTDNDVIICESHSIMSYLVTKYGENDSLYPKDVVQRASVDQRLHFDSGVFFNCIRQIVRNIIKRGARSVSPQDKEDVLEAYEFLNTFLSKSKWSAGENLTLADFSLITTATTLNSLVPIDDKFQNIIRWIEQCKSLPYYEVNKPGLDDFTQFANQVLNK